MIPRQSSAFFSSCNGDGVSTLPKTTSVSRLDFDKPVLVDDDLAQNLPAILDQKLLDDDDDEDVSDLSGKIDERLNEARPSCNGCLSFSCPVCPYEEFFKSI